MQSVKFNLEPNSHDWMLDSQDKITVCGEKERKNHKRICKNVGVEANVRGTEWKKNNHSAVEEMWKKFEENHIKFGKNSCSGKKDRTQRER